VSGGQEDDKKEGEPSGGGGDYGDDDDDGDGNASTAAAAAAAAADDADPTWLTLDRRRRARIRERVDLIIPPTSRDLIGAAVLVPLHRQRLRWEAASSLLSSPGGRVGAWAAAALPPPPLTPEEAFSQLFRDPAVQRVLKEARAETLREEERAARSVVSAAARERRWRKRQQQQQQRGRAHAM
jgi:hypothetical protein